MNQNHEKLAADFSESRHSFIQRGEGWLVTYESHSTIIIDRRGMLPIAVMLKSPFRNWALGELAEQNGEAVAHVDARYEAAFGERARSEIWQIAEEIDDDIQVAMDTGNSVRRAELEEKKAELKLELKKQTRPDGSIKMVGNEASERARKRISKQIREAVKAIGRQIPALGVHLENSIRMGLNLAYCPDRKVSWAVSFTERTCHFESSVPPAMVARSEA